MKGILLNIEKTSLNNTNFRKVLFTGQHAQLVLMSLMPGEDIGKEVHEIVDQFIRVEFGEGKLVIDSKEHKIKEGDAFIIPAGSRHNVVNTSKEKHLKLYTIYSPPHHKDGTIHKSKKAAEADKADHI